MKYDLNIRFILASNTNEVKQFVEWLFEKLIERVDDGNAVHWYLVRGIDMNDIIRYSQAIKMLLEDINTLRTIYRDWYNLSKNRPAEEAYIRLEKEAERLNFIHDMLMSKKNSIIEKEIRGKFYDVIDGFDDISKSIMNEK